MHEYTIYVHTLIWMLYICSKELFIKIQTRTVVFNFTTVLELTKS